MDSKLEAKIFRDFPEFFKHASDIKNSAMCWGMECHDGWYDLIYQLCADINVELIKEYGEIPEWFYVAQIKEKFGCYDEQTEVLTKDGWKYFNKLKYTDKLMTLENEQNIIYQTPTDIIKYDYTGKMYKLKTRGVDLLVTPNHKLYVAKGLYYNGKKVVHPFELTTYTKYFNKNKSFKKDGTWQGKSQIEFILPGYTYSNYIKLWDKTRVYHIHPKKFNMNAWLNFLGWFVAEGCANKTGDIAIACNNTDDGTERKLIQKSIEDLGYKIKTSMEDRSAFVFKIYSTQLARWLLTHCGHGAANKKTPQFIKELPPKQIQIFLNSLYLGDGHKAPTAHTLYTVSKQLANDVQELILKCGDVGHIYSYPPVTSSKTVDGRKIIGRHNVQQINWLKNSGIHSTQNKGLAKSSTEGLVDYSGTVYCATVPNHILYVRRGGKPVWCGNSLRYYLAGGTKNIHALILKAEEQSAKICEECGAPGKLQCRGFWLKTICAKCAKDKDFTDCPKF